VKFDVSIMSARLEDVGERTRELANCGIEGVFTAEGPHDVFAPLYLAAAEKTSLRLMTNAAIAFPRNPIHLAHSAFDLQRLTNGRFSLGIAPQVAAHITRRFGIPWSNPVGRMGELIDALHEIFASWQHGAPLAHEGDYYTHTLMTPMFSPAPLTGEVPAVLLGALGPAMTRLAAERADGLTVLPFCSESLLRSVTAPAVEQGLANARRSRSEIEIVCGAIVAVAESAEEKIRAIENVKALLGFYSSTKAYTRVLASIGKQDVQAHAAERVRAGAFGELGGLVDDEMVELLAVVGSPDEVAQRLDERFGWLADRLALFFPAEPSNESLTRLARSMAST
jgi:probable F420-dependent oxidoreductase